MLKITESNQGTTTTLRVEGKLRRAEAGELARICLRHLEQSQELVLDVRGVSFIDEPGIAAVRELTRRGVEVTGCSPLVASLLRETRE